ncbi:chromosome partitioning protein ParA [Gemmatimonadetes bacterium T265]|nr:chromosome partitioning protein ParA [Gemmatimonadetes bacterium T265]
MIVTVASYKGGVGKTTSAVHLAAYLQQRAPTLLVDGDPNRSATGWARRGALPFKVVDERQAARYARDFEHVVIDTEARPDEEDLRALVGGCDLLVIPTTPDALALDALMLTVTALRGLGAVNYRILLTVIPPRPSRDGDEARAMLLQSGLPVFAGGIRRLAAFQKAALSGVPVHTVSDPRAAEAWADYCAIGTQLGGTAGSVAISDTGGSAVAVAGAGRTP